jgi:Tol biopolymer transport system component
MSRIKPIARHILFVMIVGLVAYVRSQDVAAGTEVTNDNQQRVSIAVPDFVDSFTSDGSSGSDVARAIVSDLKADGRFTVVDTSITLEANAALPRFDRWRRANAEWLVVGRIRQSASNLLENGKRRPLVEISLWNVVKGTHVLGQQHIVGSADFPLVPHLIAAEVIKKLTSEPGPSNTGQ